MASLILVPFAGGCAAQAALRTACRTARRDDTLVIVLYVALVPRQLPLGADLPWLARDLTRLQLLVEPLVRETGATAWVEWVRARSLAPTIAGVAAEIEAGEIYLGVGPRPPIWLRHWSLAARLEQLAPCPVVIQEVTADATVGARLSANILS